MNAGNVIGKKIVLDGNAGEKEGWERAPVYKLDTYFNTSSYDPLHSATPEDKQAEVRFATDGEYLYMTMLGEGYKIAATEEDFVEEVGSFNEYIVVLPEELFEGITGDAENVVLTLDETALKNLYGEALGEEIGEDLSDITVKDGKITLSVKDGYLSTFNVSFTCEIDMGEEDTVTYVFSQETTFTQYGDVTVTPMEGYEDFEEMDDDLLFGDDDIVWEDDELFEDDDFFWDDELLEDEL